MELVVSEEELLWLAVRDHPHFAGREMSLEELGTNLMYQPGVFYADSPRTWPVIKEEFRILICTTDKKYSSLRRTIKKSGAKSQTVIVSIISAAMAHHLGVSVSGLLTPFCAVCLLAVLKIGKEAFCQKKMAECQITVPYYPPATAPEVVRPHVKRQHKRRA